MGVILDTSIRVTAERSRLSTLETLKRLRANGAVAEEDLLAVSAVTLTELAHGAERGRTPEIRQRRESFLQDLVSGMEVFSIPPDVAISAGRIAGRAAASGIVIPFEDLLIGATALFHGYGLVTGNVRHFRLIPGLRVIEVRC